MALLVLPPGTSALLDVDHLESRGGVVVEGPYTQLRSLYRRLRPLTSAFFPPLSRQLKVLSEALSWEGDTVEEVLTNALGEVPRDGTEAAKLFLENLYLKNGVFPDFTPARTLVPESISVDLVVAGDIDPLAFGHGEVSPVSRVKVDYTGIIFSTDPVWSQSLGDKANRALRRDYGPRAVYVTESLPVPLADAITNEMGVVEISRPVLKGPGFLAKEIAALKELSREDTPVGGAARVVLQGLGFWLSRTRVLGRWGAELLSVYHFAGPEVLAGVLEAGGLKTISL